MTSSGSSYLCYPHTRCRTSTMTINASMQHASAPAAVPFTLTISAFQPVIQEVLLISQAINREYAALLSHILSSTCCA